MKCYANFLAVFFTACIFLLGCSACGQPEEADIPEPIVVIEEPVDIEYEECSGFVGDHPCNFEFLDQNGEEWNLWNHTGTVMVIDFSTAWCSVCKNLAPHAQVYQD